MSRQGLSALAAAGAIIASVGSVVVPASPAVASVVKLPGGYDQLKLTPAGLPANANYGDSVATAGDIVAVGAKEAGFGSHIGSGRVYLYQRRPDGWTSAKPLAVLSISDPFGGDEFGFAVAMDASTIAVTALDHPNSQGSLGSVYVFTKPKGGWKSTSHSAELTATNLNSGSLYGHGLAVSGNTIVVGAPDELVYGEVAEGQAYVYQRGAHGWASGTQTANLLSSNGDSHGYFADSNAIAVNGSTIVIGAWDHESQQGAAYLFSKPKSGWTGTLNENRVFTATGLSDTADFGISVAIDSSGVVIGAPNQNDKNQDGDAYVYPEPKAGWTASNQPLVPAASLVEPDPSGSEQFGQTVAVSSRGVVVGAFDDNVGANTHAGAIYTFDLTKQGLPAKPTARIVVAGEELGGNLGTAIAASATTIVAGLARIGGYTGAAYVFADPGPTITKPTFADHNREVVTKVSAAATVTVHLLRKNKHGRYVAGGTVRKPALKAARAVVALHHGQSLPKGRWEIEVSATNPFGTTPVRTLHLTVH